MKRPILRKIALHSTGFYRRFHLQAPKSRSTSKPVQYVLITSILLFWAVSSEAKWNVIIHDNRRYVPIEDVAAFYKMNMPATSTDRFRLEAPGRSIEGADNGRNVYINGVKYALCFPIVPQGGQTLISAMDVVKIIEPILRPQKIKNASPVRTVILDAGHGGIDSGATGPLGKEKDATLDVVLRAKKLLEETGYQVRCTRLTDFLVPLEERAQFANRYANAIFVSVHFNKSNRGQATGLETYCLAPRGVPSMDEENLSYSDYVQHPGHANDPANIALATTVHAALVRSLGLTDRGVKRARFVVIKNVTIPGILIEGGFMSGTPDARLIATAEYRQRIAQCILDGVNRYKEAVANQTQKPSAVVAATDPTSVPNLDRAVGAQTGMEPSVAQAQDALKSSAGGN
jgi:N-acetylmuramoyl-L-alanine amidase